MLPEGLEDRYRELRRHPELRVALLAEREAAVERTAFATGRDLWIPEVPLRPGATSLRRVRSTSRSGATRRPGWTRAAGRCSSARGSEGGAGS